MVQDPEDGNIDEALELSTGSGMDGGGKERRLLTQFPICGFAERIVSSNSTFKVKGSLSSLWGACPRKSVLNLQSIPRQQEETVLSSYLAAQGHQAVQKSSCLLPCVLGFFLCALLRELMDYPVLGMEMSS